MRVLTHGFACLSLLAATLLVATGCGATKTEPNPNLNKLLKDGHPTEGTHGGALAHWGEGDDEIHPEFTVDMTKKKVTVYILDNTAKKAAPIEAETIKVTLTSVDPSVEITLKSDPDTGETKGKSSRFVGEHEKLPEKGPYKGSISGKVGIVEFTGDFETGEDGNAIKKK